jgi:hypothetical protein
MMKLDETQFLKQFQEATGSVGLLKKGFFPDFCAWDFL